METFSTPLFWYVNYFSAVEEVEIKNFRTWLINSDNLNIVCTINIPGLSPKNKREVWRGIMGVGDFNLV